MMCFMLLVKSLGIQHLNDVYTNINIYIYVYKPIYTYINIYKNMYASENFLKKEGCGPVMSNVFSALGLKSSSIWTNSGSLLKTTQDLTSVIRHH